MVLIDSDKNLQWMLKLGGRSLVKKRTLTVLKLPPTSYLLIIREKIATLLWKKLADSVLNR